MRTILTGICIALALSVMAQKECGHATYLEQQKSTDPAFAARVNSIEQFISQRSNISFRTDDEHNGIIRIPVVVHVLYKTEADNISDDRILDQIEALNRDFRKRNADTASIPAHFRSLAADIGIEFALATSDPSGKSTTGIVRKKVNRMAWGMDDHIKSSARGGDDAWDTRYYLNIWVGNLVAIAGYATFPGNDVKTDGIVMATGAFGNNSGVFSMGRTAVHEVGHWLGLKHIWGDSWCGDDGVGDTPKQGSYTTGCPTSFRSSCNNSTGDMYMNYMDYTNDACMNMFTEGQKSRMLVLFEPGGPRSSFRSSKGLSQPWTVEIPTVEEPVIPVRFRTYPNPSAKEVVLNFEHDSTWVGQKLLISRASGGIVMQVQITSVTQKLDISRLQPGIYFIRGDFGKKWISHKLVKL